MTPKAKEIEDFSKEELIGLLRDAAVNWLAHDGLWFRAAEDKFGLEAALELDKDAWEKFTVIEAKRIMKRIDLPVGGGIPALIQALKLRLYARINIQEVSEVSASRCVFRMRSCRVQEARERQGVASFPCKPIGIVEYSGFARTIDPRIETRCLSCPPDPKTADSWCAWEFTIPDKM
ncbi:MAG: DUF6125 family protein [Candidatus Aminicenantes bacterium]|nr:DUF6125 family protein [Candidatus Aminicenantes bacterium]